ncbi:MAG: LuxR C-terminal-related transcriptional regulator [Pseudomonadota bacterium]|uniref:helix-turn-helix transcriptional regulator n=1 Tax=Fulvimarina manganoxydans TaxID=937218 RepID=UPI0023521303|nr:LuxR C-terminal-related transcriptional regulator [Fulvimarina manganoxydans]MEE2952751.1 LuxR C-terminal-related transcriptional regulator [Pseudomonadota bacterium]
MDYLDLIDQLDALDDPASVWKAGVRYFRRFGIDGVYFLDLSSIERPKALWSHPSIERHSHSVGLTRRPDPLQQCFKTLRPCPTGADFAKDHSELSEGERALIEAFGEESGLKTGSSITVKRHPLGRGCGFNILSSLGREGFLKTFERHRTDLVMGAQLIASGLKPEEVRQPDDASRLTSRECDCLAFVASGLRIAEIAQRLGVSVVTIEFHLRNARQKLGAQTRDHAVALALMRGAINP